MPKSPKFLTTTHTISTGLSNRKPEKLCTNIWFNTACVLQKICFSQRRTTLSKFHGNADFVLRRTLLKLLKTTPAKHRKTIGSFIYTQNYKSLRNFFAGFSLFYNNRICIKLHFSSENVFKLLLGSINSAGYIVVFYHMRFSKISDGSTVFCTPAYLSL